MNRRNYLWITLLFFGSSLSFGQTDSLFTTDSLSNKRYFERHISIFTGFHFKGNHLAELGIGVMEKSTIGTHPNTLIYGISNEFKVTNDLVWGVKGALWMGGGAAAMNLGLNIIRYTDFNENALRFRPEFGFGISAFRIVYGYNVPLTNRNFNKISRHNFSLNVMLNVKKLKVN